MNRLFVLLLAGFASIPVCAANAREACAQLLHPVFRGQALLISDLGGITCPSDNSTIARLHYDRNARLVRAVRDMSVGEIVHATPETYLAQARQGDAVSIVQRDGAITINQRGTALIDVAQGHPLIVRSTDGRLLTISASQTTSP